jgi:hypothetical protein
MSDDTLGSALEHLDAARIQAAAAGAKELSHMLLCVMASGMVGYEAFDDLIKLMHDWRLRHGVCATPH